MSVINRMLEDLERRQDGPGGDRPAGNVPPGLAPRAGRGRLLVIAVALVVALLVLGVAAVAWRAADGLSLPVPIDNQESAADTTVAEAAAVETTPAETTGPVRAKAESPASDAATVTSSPRPVLRESDTLIKPSGARIALTFDRPLAELPVVRHENRRTDFWLPNARLDGNALVFLAGLEQAARVESSSDEQGTSLSIEPADGSRLDVEADREGIVLAFTTSHPRPAAPAEPASQPATDARAGGSRSKPDASGEPVAASAQDDGQAGKSEKPAGEERPTETLAATSESAPVADDDEASPSMGIRPAAASLRQQIRKQIAQGDTAGARARLESTLASDPSRQDLWRLLATLDMREGADAQAVSRLSRVADPAPATLALLGLAARRADRPEAAVAAYAQALESSPERADWWAGLGIAMESAGRGDGAGSAYRRALGAEGLSRELQAYVERRMAALGGNGRSGAN